MDDVHTKRLHRLAMNAFSHLLWIIVTVHILLWCSQPGFVPNISTKCSNNAHKRNFLRINKLYQRKRICTVWFTLEAWSICIGSVVSPHSTFIGTNAKVPLRNPMSSAHINEWCNFSLMNWIVITPLREASVASENRDIRMLGCHA